MVTYKIYTFLYFNVDYDHQEHLFWREWNYSQFQNTSGGVKIMKFWIARLLKTLIFGRPKHLKIRPKSSQTPSPTRQRFSKKNPGWCSQKLFNGRFPVSHPVPQLCPQPAWIPFPFRSHLSLRERTYLCIAFNALYSNWCLFFQFCFSRNTKPEQCVCTMQ